MKIGYTVNSYFCVTNKWTDGRRDWLMLSSHKPSFYFTKNA